MAIEASVAPGGLALRLARRESDRERVDVAGVGIDMLDLDTAVDRVREFLAASRCHQIVTVNLDFLSIAARDLDFHETLNMADLAVADGMPLVWASRLMEQPLPTRITGNQLVEECCRLGAELGASVFLLGAADGIADAAADVLEERFPGLEVAGTYSPTYGPLTPAENERIIRMINASGASILFVALGAPRQDLWIRENQHRLNVKVAMGVGCVLDIVAGNVRRAPNWMQKVGLEWAYRLGQEPQRLWRRYIVDDMPMLGQIFWAAVRQDGEPLAVAMGHPRA